MNLNDHSKKFINDEDAIIEVNKFNLNLSTNQVKNINDQFTNKWPLDNINNIKEEDM